MLDPKQASFECEARFPGESTEKNPFRAMRIRLQADAARGEGVVMALVASFGGIG
jgi:hypothetical protein